MARDRIMRNLKRMAALAGLTVSLVFTAGYAGYGQSQQPSPQQGNSPNAGAPATPQLGDGDPLVVEMEHLILTMTDKEVNVVDIVNVKNNTDKEIPLDSTGKQDKDPTAFSISLPKEATDFKMMEQANRPIPAKAAATLAYSYKLPETGGHFILTTKRPYVIQNLNVLIPQGQSELQVQNQHMQDNGPMEFEGQNFHVYSTDSIKAGQSIDMTLLPVAGGKGQGNQATPSGQGNSGVGQVTRTAPDFHNPGHVRMWNQSALKQFNPHILLLVFSAILIAGIGFYSYRKWRNAKTNALLDENESMFQQLFLKQKVILNKLVELEEAYERSELPDEEYNLKREAYKTRLVEIKLKLLELVK